MTMDASENSNQPSPSPEAATEKAAPGLDRRLLECLICPVSQGPLRFRRETMELLSPKARLAFPIRSGVPILLESEARELADGEV